MCTIPYICTYLPCMHGLLAWIACAWSALGVSIVCMSPFQHEEVLSPRNPRRHHATGRVLCRCGDRVQVYWCKDTGAPRLECVLNCLYCMLQQHRAIGLQSDCMVVVPAPVVRLPDCYVYALWP